jgi:arylsulfatase A-like enzyme
MVSTQTPDVRIAPEAAPAQAPEVPYRLRPRDVLVLSAWCGLAGGLLEVATRLLLKNFAPTPRLYLMSRHFVWLAPLSNLLLFIATGVFLALLTRLAPRFGGWLSARILAFLAIWPTLVLLGPQIYPAAWAVLALGLAWRLVPLLERQGARLRPRLLISCAVLVGASLLSAGWVVGSNWQRERREAQSPPPRPETPNVLFITLDTVRADHLSVYGYERPTTPTLEWLARSSIRFEEARATAPWTLPSHASMFTGRWAEELKLGWTSFLDGRFPTLAEYLVSHGYATAGFVANTMCCSYDRRLDRGFTHFEDYLLEGLLPLRTAWLVDRALGAVADLGMYVGRAFDVGPFRPLHESWASALFDDYRRLDATAINRAFFDWLAQERHPNRPFFAFLNYYDAHAPYILPLNVPYRFGLRPRGVDDLIFLSEFWQNIDKRQVPPMYRELARDSYDNCVSYLDRCLAQLFAELEKRGELDRTVVVVTSDHGEEFGEHGLYDHGESLYRAEIRVPLLIRLPARGRTAGLVRETVSLRDLPATIVELAGLSEGSPFPGESLASLWRGSPAGAGSPRSRASFSELPSPSPTDPNHGRSPAYRGPLASVAEGDHVYIRNEGDGAEELYNERDDPGEAHNLAAEPAMQPTLGRLRQALEAHRSHPER